MIYDESEVLTIYNEAEVLAIYHGIALLKNREVSHVTVIGDSNFYHCHSTFALPLMTTRWTISKDY